MNKREIAEIRKQFTPERCAITRIAGCYVDADKNIRTLMKEAFYSIPEEETFKYFDIFKKTLSGKTGKNLLDLEFLLKSEQAGGGQDFLLRLRDSKLSDDGLLEDFYTKVIENFNYPENYYIILIHMAYDIPGKGSDEEEMFDASEDVYECILCSICPVKLSKPGLSYDTSQNAITERIRDWVVDPPVNGFLFPAFNDRAADIHSMLYYSKKADDIQPELIEQLFGCQVPQTQKDQKESFHTLVEDVLGEDADYEAVRGIQETLEEIVEEHADSPDPVLLGCREVRKVFEMSGIPEEKLEGFEEMFDSTVGKGTEILLSNIAGESSVTVEVPDVTIRVNPERLDLIETKVIEGRECIVIAADSRVSLNGLEVRTCR